MSGPCRRFGEHEWGPWEGWASKPGTEPLKDENIRFCKKCHVEYETKTRPHVHVYIEGFNHCIGCYWKK